MVKKSKGRKLRSHVYLFDEMAEKLGKDLEMRVLEGRISSDEIVEAVHKCSDCQSAETCASQLPKEKGLKEAYGYCANRELFKKL
jgi:hypothetical protein